MTLPRVGTQVPGIDSKVAQFLGKCVLRVSGWQLVGEVPNLPKFVLIAAPHTSNWDAFYGFAAILALGMKVNWAAKHTLFPKPLKGVLHALGGIPIDRTVSHGVVDQMKEIFARRDKLVLVITPEGTRRRVPKWRTGFYHMACAAGIPIQVGFLDYSRKRLGFGPLITPGREMATDMAKIQDFYTNIGAKHPEAFNPDILGEAAEKAAQ
ncbi:MAG: lysophospholipid acyltransferase family protein [bacterium]